MGYTHCRGVGAEHPPVTMWALSRGYVRDRERLAGRCAELVVCTLPRLPRVPLPWSEGGGRVVALTSECIEDARGCSA